MTLAAGGGTISVDSDEHEAAIVRESMLRDLSLFQGYGAERFDGIRVEL